MQSTNFNRDDMQSIRHPDGHGIDCRINERRGEIEIIRGKCITILKVPPRENTGKIHKTSSLTNREIARRQCG